MSAQNLDSKNHNFLSLKDSIFIAIISGIIGGVIKLGWEVMFPPRTFERDLTNPPQALLELFGFSYDFTHLTYTFSGHALPLVSFIVHFSFSVACAFIYVRYVTKEPHLMLKKAALYGIIIFILFHIIIMPLLGVVPSALNQPLQEHLSEFFGHIFWLYVIEITRFTLVMNIKK
ncbi:DUF1440 domain-containing protein [Helicobacter saguini]|uniref:DUF1440 domain-containing protein n=1 Tax=Helicobacter saguini TaxID=1548018 RepID=A0A347VSX8_9HELI|nr:DUF1440 domain-containing protein [Helicobacter saguini]MWV62324.1 DUF1440 domain-containing protein [Helicobacter saguini]MWV67005.1 DUF1440 domain-containing protein [Helicobacter saguini]MWV69353.1 DUF1440 domain-containing protein [Helicobacter saguini]MWV71092.1 DUF1440 domain-containing protein [Helicobacter saguini]TLD95011.1 DUF1440 domain-containing protein [Helicobacter saguini]